MERKEEIWKDIPEYEGIYQASNFGRIRSLKRRAPRILKQSFRKEDGYNRVNLFKDGKGKNCQVHRLIALAFLPNPDNKPTVDHIDKNKTNNNIENLRWATSSEQNEYKKGNKIEQSNLTKMKVQCIETEEIFTNSAAAAHWVIDNGLTESTRTGYVAERIRFVAEGGHGRHTAFGYNWKFLEGNK